MTAETTAMSGLARQTRATRFQTEHISIHSSVKEERAKPVGFTSTDRETKNHNCGLPGHSMARESTA